MKMKDSKLYKHTFDVGDQLEKLGVVYHENGLVFRTREYVEELVKTVSDIYDDQELMEDIEKRTKNKSRKKFEELLWNQAELITLLKFFPEQKGLGVEVNMCHVYLCAMMKIFQSDKDKKSKQEMR